MSQSRFAGWIDVRRRWVLLGMLVSLHLALVEGPPSLITSMLMVVHIGLFFLWQPFVRTERHLEFRHLAAIGLVLAAVLLWLHWWLLIVWVVLLAGIIGGKVFIYEGRASRLFYLLALAYLLSVQLTLLVPNVLPEKFAVGGPIGVLARYGLPWLFLIMAVLPAEREGSHAEVVDFAYSLFVVLTVAVLMLGAIASMLLRGTNYIQSLLEVMLVFGIGLLFLAWVWDPRAGFSGVGAIFSRYMLTIGMPFEHWVHSLSEYAQREGDPEEFLEWACGELIRRIPWVVGGEWRTPVRAGKFGNSLGRQTDFRHGPLAITLTTRQALTPALAWHLHVVTQLLAEFYTARVRARELGQLSYLQAVYETGARLTHDVKNLLQSLNTLCYAAAGEAEESSSQFQSLLRRQLPAIAQRLEQTLDKLSGPAKDDADFEAAPTWWDGLVRRYAGEAVVFEPVANLGGLVLPGSLFSSAAENLLQNALEKRGTTPGVQVHVRLDVVGGRPLLSVTDDGDAVPQHLAAQLGRGPVASENGLGIGLYQVARYAELMGYRLRLADNRPGDVRFALEPMASESAAVSQG